MSLQITSIEEKIILFLAANLSVVAILICALMDQPLYWLHARNCDTSYFSNETDYKTGDWRLDFCKKKSINILSDSSLFS